MIVDKSMPSTKDKAQNISEQQNTNFTAMDFSNIWVKKPWGHEYMLFENEDVAIWILHIQALQQTSMHAHLHKNTSLICLKGEVVCKTLDEASTLTRLNGIYLGKHVYHQTSNQSNQEAIVMEIESPVNKFDLCRIDDKYGRTAMAYEDYKHYEKKEGLTIKNRPKQCTYKKLGECRVEIGYAKSKEELLTLYDNKDEAVIITLLNRNIWNENGQKAFEVGQLLVLSEAVLNSYKINNNFIYLKITKQE